MSKNEVCFVILQGRRLFRICFIVIEIISLVLSTNVSNTSCLLCILYDYLEYCHIICNLYDFYNLLILIFQSMQVIMIQTCVIDFNIEE